MSRIYNVKLKGTEQKFQVYESEKHKGLYLSPKYPGRAFTSDLIDFEEEPIEEKGEEKKK
jgi:hypothetical protein